MPHKTLINTRQLIIGVYLCLVCDSLIRPLPGGAVIAAYGRIFGAFLCATVVLFLFGFLLKKCQTEGFVALLAAKTPHSKWVLCLLSFAFLLGAARSLQQSEMFYRYATGQTLPLTLLLLLILVVCLYAAHTGLEVLLRTGTVLAILLAGSLVLIAIANAPQMRLQNLQIPQQPIESIWQSCMTGFNLTPELLLVGVLGHSCGQQKNFGILFKILLLTVVSDVVFTLISELVLGQFEALQVQPIHTLARLGGISVFRRLDAVHVSVWLLIAVFRTALLCVGLGEVLRPLLPSKAKQAAVWVVALPIFAVAVLLYHVPELVQQWAETFFVFAAGAGIAFAMRKEKAHE